MSTTYVATDLDGSVRYFPQGPYAFGDPVQSFKARIRIDEPAEIEEVNDRQVLYQKYYLYDADQIPGGADVRSDTERIKHYVDELRAVLTEYPDRLSQLTVLEAAESKIAIHGMVPNGYDGADETEVVRLSPSVRWQIQQWLEREHC